MNLTKFTAGVVGGSAGIFGYLWAGSSYSVWYAGFIFVSILLLWFLILKFFGK